jgi:Secretion system C-terminal sorting domain
MNNNQLSELQQQWNGSAWENDGIFTYTYDANNNQTSSLFQNWNGSTWENGGLTTNTYDVNNNQMSSLLQSWNGIVWQNSGLAQYTYDVNSNLTYKLWQTWNGSVWVTSDQTSYSFDSNNFMKSSAYKHINGTDTTTILNGDSIYYYFHTAIGINDLTVNDDAGINIYPNPSSGSFTLQAINQPFNNAAVTISNMLGEKIYSSVINSKSSIINFDVPNGIYFVQLKSVDRVATRKLIVQH